MLFLQPGKLQEISDHLLMKDWSGWSGCSGRPSQVARGRNYGSQGADDQRSEFHPSVRPDTSFFFLSSP